MMGLGGLWAQDAIDVIRNVLGILFSIIILHIITN